MDKQRLGFSNLPGNTEGKHFRTMTGRQLSIITKPVPSVYTQLHWLAKVFSTAGGKSFSPKPFRKMGPWRVHRQASWCCKKLDCASAITAPYRGASTCDNKAGPKLVLRKTAMKTAFIHSFTNPLIICWAFTLWHTRSLESDFILTTDLPLGILQGIRSLHSGKGRGSISRHRDGGPLG